MAAGELAGKQPFFNVKETAVFFQELSGFFRKKGAAIFSALAEPNIDYFPGQIHMFLFKGDDLADTQAGGINQHQQKAVFRVLFHAKNKANFFL